MSSLLIDGKIISQDLLSQVKRRAESFKEKSGRSPRAAFITIGENKDSKKYVSLKAKKAKSCAIDISEHQHSSAITTEELCSFVKALSEQEDVDGILVQLPLPPHINVPAVLDSISPDKDIDGLCSRNISNLHLGHPGLIPCTPMGVLALAKHARRQISGIDSLSGLHACIIGRSNLVGKPCATLFTLENCTTTLCHSQTQDLESFTKKADILVSAAGVPELVDGEMLKPGAIAIDVGISYVDGKVLGDLEFESCQKIAAAITPVPGGVGPLTIAMLLQNIVYAAENSSKNK